MKKQNVIWIASYSDDENRWMRSVLRHAAIQSGLPPAGIDSVYKLKVSGEAPAACEAVSADLAKNGPHAVLGTRAAPVAGKRRLHGIPGLRLATAGFIYVSRNPLDVLLAYIDQSRTGAKRMAKDEKYKDGLFIDLLGFDKHVDADAWSKSDLGSIPQANLDHALQRFSDSGLKLPGLEASWSDHVQAWMDTAGSTPRVILRYEDRIENPKRLVEITKFFRFPGATVLKTVRALDRKASGTGKAGQAAGAGQKRPPHAFADRFSKAAVQKFVASNAKTLERYGYGDLASRI